MEELFCIKCDYSEFLDPKKEICWKTGGVFCTKLERVVAKYDHCHIDGGPTAVAGSKTGRKSKTGKKKAARGKRKS